MQELHEENNRLANRNYQYVQQVNRSVHRIALQPVARRQNQQPTTLEIVHQQQTNNLATLSRNPRDLYLLWSEYEFGIGNRKPAREFTAVERGRVKYNYHRRKVVWDKIAELVRAGWTSDMAIDAIYNAYGRHLPVTQIINAMRRDWVNGGHPSLQV